LPFYDFGVTAQNKLNYVVYHRPFPKGFWSRGGSESGDSGHAAQTASAAAAGLLRLSSDTQEKKNTWCIALLQFLHILPVWIYE